MKTITLLIAFLLPAAFAHANEVTQTFTDTTIAGVPYTLYNGSVPVTRDRYVLGTDLKRNKVFGPYNCLNCKSSIRRMQPVADGFCVRNGFERSIAINPGQAPLQAHINIGFERVAVLNPDGTIRRVVGYEDNEPYLAINAVTCAKTVPNAQ